MGARTQIAMDRSAVAAGVLGGERVRFFRDGVRGPARGDHLAISTPVLGHLALGVASAVAVETLVGPMAAGVLLAHDAGPEAPVLVSHHGNNERAFDLGERAKNSLDRALLTPAPVPATVVLLRAPTSSCDPARRRAAGRRCSPRTLLGPTVPRWPASCPNSPGC